MLPSRGLEARARRRLDMGHDWPSPASAVPNSSPEPNDQAFRFPNIAGPAARKPAFFLGPNLGAKSAKSQGPEGKRRPEREFGGRSAYASPRSSLGPRPNPPFRALPARTESVSPKANGVGKGTGSEHSLKRRAGKDCSYVARTANRLALCSHLTSVDKAMVREQCPFGLKPAAL
jgi:hypothetical protein